MTADNVIGIFTSRAMKERGRYQIQFMKTRSSSGVGQKVDLEFNLDTLRITDLNEDEDTSSFSQQRAQQSTGGGNSAYQGLKRTSVVSTTSVDDATGEIIDPTVGISANKFKNNTSSRPASIRGMLTMPDVNPERD
jgi:hypothetical protein